MLCAAQAAEHTNNAAEDTNNVTNTNSLPRAVANASADRYHDRTAKISEPQLATEGTGAVFAAGEGGARGLSSTRGRGELPIPTAQQPSLWGTCATAHEEEGSGESSSMIDSHCRMKGDNDAPGSVYKQHHPEEVGDSGDETDIGRDDRESGFGGGGFGRAEGDRVYRAAIDPWKAYKVVAEADPVTSWEVLRQVRIRGFNNGSRPTACLFDYLDFSCVRYVLELCLCTSTS